MAWDSTQLVLESGTHFGFVFEGSATITFRESEYTLPSGMYFTIPGDGLVSPASRESKGIVMSRLNYTGFFQIGGPVEEKGRLQYIDGCTDSLLISPVMFGDPCLNLLHIPPHTKQTQHTHPSLRLGMIISGSGICKTPEMDFPLSPGTLFYIPAGGLHSFHTDSDALRVIAWHPDSDFGPTHENHPMVNKTVIDKP